MKCDEWGDPKVLCAAIIAGLLGASLVFASGSVSRSIASRPERLQEHPTVATGAAVYLADGRLPASTSMVLPIGNAQP